MEVDIDKAERKARRQERRAEKERHRADQAASDGDRREKSLSEDEGSKKNQRFSAARDMTWKESQLRPDLKHGAFSKREKERIHEEFERYQAENRLSMDDIANIIKGDKEKNNKERREFLALVADRALPHRSYASVHYILKRMVKLSYCSRSGQRFSHEEDEALRAHVRAKGLNDWITIGEQLERIPNSCRDRWRQMGYGHDTSSLKKGPWDKSEEKRLVEVVTGYLDTKKKVEEAGERAALDLDEEEEAAAVEAQREGFDLSDTVGPGKKKYRDKNSKGFKAEGRSLLDCIDWDVIAHLMDFTRSGEQCRHKWYRTLSPSMIERGDWGKGDDKRMLIALRDGEYEVEWAVPWESLVEGRTEQAAKRRWLLMQKAVSNYRDMEFVEIVDYLVDKYITQREQQAAEQAAQQAAQQQQQQTGEEGSEELDFDEHTGEGESGEGAEQQHQQQKQESGDEGGHGVQGDGSGAERKAEKKRKRQREQQEREEQLEREEKRERKRLKKQRRAEQEAQAQAEQAQAQAQAEQQAQKEQQQRRERKRLKRQRREEQAQAVQQQQAEQEQAQTQHELSKEERKEAKRRRREAEQQQQQQQGEAGVQGEGVKVEEGHLKKKKKRKSADGSDAAVDVKQESTAEGDEAAERAERKRRRKEKRMKREEGGD